MARLRNQSPLFRTLEAYLPLVPPFVQIANAGRLISPSERPPDVSLRSDLSPIRGQRETWIGAKKCRNLLRLRFVNVQLVRQQSRIVQLKAVFHLHPVPCGGRERLRLLCARSSGNKAQQREQQATP